MLTPFPVRPNKPSFQLVKVQSAQIAQSAPQLYLTFGGGDNCCALNCLHIGKQGWLRPERQRSVSMVASSSGTSASGESADDKVGKGVLSDVGGVVGTQGPAGEATA